MKIIREEYIEHINKWWNTNSKDALIVLGVKNVGKTSLIREWAKENRVSNTYFSKELYESIKDIFEDLKSKSFDTSVAIINKLMLSQPLNELLIFDGIKPNDEILVQIKKLCSISKHRFILISDYGEYVFDNIRFLPVGSINKLIVRPLSFREYCLVKLNKYIVDSVCAVLEEEGKKYPFSDQFEEAWNEYSNYGGFPSVVSNLLEKGIPSALAELDVIKNDILDFVRNISFSNNLLLILNNFGNERSKKYHRFVFSSLSENGTYKRYKRAIFILERMGIIGVLPLEGNSLNFEYCDMFLCDPGLERIWKGNLGRHHIAESIVYSFGLRRRYKVSRLVIDKDKIVDISFDAMVTWLIDIKLRNTNSAVLSELKLRNYGDSFYDACRCCVLIDKGVNFFKSIENVNIYPIWAFLLME